MPQRDPQSRPAPRRRWRTHRRCCRRPRTLLQLSVTRRRPLLPVARRLLPRLAPWRQPRSPAPMAWRRSRVRSRSPRWSHPAAVATDLVDRTDSPSPPDARLVAGPSPRREGPSRSPDPDRRTPSRLRSTPDHQVLAGSVPGSFQRTRYHDPYLAFLVAQLRRRQKLLRDQLVLRQPALLQQPAPLHLLHHPPTTQPSLPARPRRRNLRLRLPRRSRSCHPFATDHHRPAPHHQPS